MLIQKMIITKVTNKYHEIIKLFFIKPTNNTFLQLFRYTFVGGFAFVVDFSLLFCLTEYCHLHYLLSAIFAFIAGVAVNYIISVRWVFRKSSFSSKTMEFISFTIIGIIGVTFTELLMWMLTEKMGLYFMLSKIITTGFVYLWNFFSRKFLIFK